jgi:hypothetical protein
MSQAPWRSACLSPVVPGTKIHAMALTPFVFLIFRFSMTWLLCCLAMVMVLGWMQFKGLQPAWIIRRAKCRLRGHWVSARSIWIVRRRSRIESFDGVDLDFSNEAN